MIAIYTGAVIALVSLLFLRRDEKLVRQLKHQRSLAESELNKLKEKRRKESNKYQGEEPQEQPSLSEKLVRTLSKGKAADDDLINTVIEYLDEGTSQAAINQNPLSRWMSWIKISFYALVVLMILGLGMWLYSLYTAHEAQHERIGVVGVVR